MERYYGHKPVNIVLLEYVKEQNNLLNRHFIYCRSGKELILWAGHTRENLLHFFSSNLLEKRYYYADRIVNWLLLTHDTEEFNEFRRSLTQLEIDGKLHSNYRDHTNHTLMVFILGAYLYEKLDKFREYYRYQCTRDRKLDSTIPDPSGQDKVDDNFMFDWLYVSLLHDIGYTFSQIDEDGQKGSFLLSRALMTMDSFFNHYLRNWFEPNERSDQLERDLIDLHILLDMCMEVPKVKAGTNVNEEELKRTIKWLINCPYFAKLSPDMKSTSSFEILQSYCNLFSSQQATMLKEYFLLLAREGEATPNTHEKRRVFDHGILSALIYMKLVSFGHLLVHKIKDIQVDQIQSMRQRELIRRIKEDIGLFIYDRDSYYEFVGIAWAIALHNIRPLAEHQRADFDKLMFPIKPKDSFLACLLYLVDILQDWDRDKLRLADYSTPEKASLQSYEISIEVKKDRIKVSYINNDVTRERIEKMKKDIEDNLDKEISSMVDFDPIAEDSFFKIDT